MNSAQRIIEKFGGQSELARLLGTAQSTVQYWAQVGVIPVRRQADVLRAAGERGIRLLPVEFLPGDPGESKAPGEEEEAYRRGFTDGHEQCLEQVIRRLSAPGVAGLVRPGIHFAHRLQGMKQNTEEIENQG